MVQFIFKNVIQFKQTDIGVRILLTLTELATLPEPYYLFVFTQVTTKETVAFIKSVADDFSNYPDRYNEYQIDPSALFANKQIGDWNYVIYEQTSATNLLTANTTGIVEQGKMILERGTDFAFKMYDQATTFKTYNG